MWDMALTGDMLALTWDMLAPTGDILSCVGCRRLPVRLKVLKTFHSRTHRSRVGFGVLPTFGCWSLYKGCQVFMQTFNNQICLYSNLAFREEYIKIYIFNILKAYIYFFNFQILIGYPEKMKKVIHMQEGEGWFYIYLQCTYIVQFRVG